MLISLMWSNSRARRLTLGLACFGFVGMHAVDLSYKNEAIALISERVPCAHRRGKHPGETAMRSSRERKLNQ
ncbi:hypothetical protein BDQ94DRAFT_138766 [Aspergillus welwitschiae]|uniref:Uncharacterized protein n=1 Tax=Aspergillus welwitschiae TaxID=1341132 RepID=A0A3F3QAJ2_9EURO|nr:hypothetical protein BDQ94DRAFT_138766 [Aspergillus welwitschiae]RDH36244.1 hypothetical protein BDQ94DRAFT_138766 [Aspergillus welwitschiae]